MRRLLAASLILVTACSRDRTEPPAPAPEDPVSTRDTARAASAIAELKRSLVGALTKAMANGVPAAIDVCHTEAPAIATALARDGMTIGRATRKPRNPRNLVSGWTVDAVTHFEQLRAAGTKLEGASFSRRLPGGRIAYAEPLVIQPLCLACHGETLAPEVQQALAARYPEDRATGYVAGDLRGVAWVELSPTD